MRSVKVPLATKRPQTSMLSLWTGPRRVLQAGPRIRTEALSKRLTMSRASLSLRGQGQENNKINEQDQRVQRVVPFRRWAIVAACLPLGLLAGRPQQKAAAPGSPPATATAPAAQAP